MAGTVPIDPGLWTACPERQERLRVSGPIRPRGCHVPFGRFGRCVAGGRIPSVDRVRNNPTSEEAAMSVVMMIDNPNGSQEIYEKVASGFSLPLGGRVHVAGPRPGGGWRVIEVWDTEDE